MDVDSWVDTILSSFEILLSCVGFLFNASVIYITLRANWLHTPCNILLAAYEFCLIFFDVEKFFEEAVFGDNEYPMSQCFWMVSPFFALFSTSFVLMASIAVDRFISVVFPLHYHHLNKKLSAFIICLFSLLNMSFLLVLAYLEMAEAPSNLTTCGITSTLQNNATYFSAIGLGCQLFSILLYIILWVNIRWNSSGANDTTRRLFKSLISIVLFSLLGFVPNTIYYLIGRFLDVPNFWHPQTLLGIIFMELSEQVALISCCSNAVILCIFSGEYRRAFCTFLPFLRHIFNDSSQNPSLVIQQRQQRMSLPGSTMQRSTRTTLVVRQVAGLERTNVVYPE